MFRFKKINPAQAQEALAKMGIKSEKLAGVVEVVIKLAEKEIIIPHAQVTATDMKGIWNYLVAGDQRYERSKSYSP